MSSKPFAIESFPVEERAFWIVVPSSDREEVEIRLDLGGGSGPLLASGEWIPARYERVNGTSQAPGFLCWHVDGETVFSAPSWAPATVLRAVQTMALQLHEQHQRELGA